MREAIFWLSMATLVGVVIFLSSLVILNLPTLLLQWVGVVGMVLLAAGVVYAGYYAAMNASSLL